ncbi:hypothetical protein [Sulfitobacter sp.]|uniref:hypothetical protein n=1 Tax=Sulfitobacter sp. TaxID=1903071 RepID=UPI003002E5C1
MPTTAFSSRFKRELDPEQLLMLMGADPIAAISPEHREFISNDVVCSSCGVTGAQIVSQTKSRATAKAIRQPHFRFRSPIGQDAHNKFCEFNEEATRSSELFLINFADERSAETRFIRSLVCKGIENGIFDQQSIREMRQWFFELKCKTRIRMTTKTAAINWMEGLVRHIGYREPFQPGKAEKLNFNWKQAARFSFAEDHSQLLEFLRQKRVASRFPISSFTRAKALSKTHFEQDVLDTSILRPYYTKAVDLAAFVAIGPDSPIKKACSAGYYKSGAPTYLLALCALLLFVSKWELDDAKELVTKLFLAPMASDQTLGNVMGLNPFHDYGAWEVLAIASELAALSPANPDLDKILEETEARLREEHRLWREATNE